MNEEMRKEESKRKKRKDVIRRGKCIQMKNRTDKKKE